MLTAWNGTIVQFRSPYLAKFIHIFIRADALNELGEMRSPSTGLRAFFYPEDKKMRVAHAHPQNEKPLQERLIRRVSAKKKES